jgi:alkylhydroperoxidase family enzyme
VPTHLALGSSAGLTDEELSWLNGWQEAPVFDDTDRLVLRYADALTRENRVDEALYAALAARFPPRELFELCMAVSLSALVNRAHATFLTDVDERTAQRVAQLDLHERHSEAADGG